MESWANAWTLTAWCEVRRDFRVFCLDRIDALDLTDARFRDEAGKRLGDYLASMKAPPEDDT